MNFDTNVEMTQSYSYPNSDNSVARKRQIKCGNCSGCLVLKNCGLCVFCIRRKTGKQICKERKCIEILKKQLERKKKSLKKESKRKQVYENFHQSVIKLTDNVNASLDDKFTKQHLRKKTSIKHYNKALNNPYNDISFSDEKIFNKFSQSSDGINNISVSHVTLAANHESLINSKLLEDKSEVKLLETSIFPSLQECCNITEKYKKLTPKRKIEKQNPTKYKPPTTPEITEPRTSILESEQDLIKKVRPHSAGPLPSFSTFVHEFSPLSKQPLEKNLLSLPTSPQKNQTFLQKNQTSPEQNYYLKNESFIFETKLDNFKHKKSVQPKYSKIKINAECGCAVSETVDTGPFYNHLGSGYSLEELRKTLLDRFSIQNASLNLQLVKHTSVEGKNGDGCPLAKWIIRRTSEEEKYLVIVRHHEGHTCSSTFTVIVIVAWEGISKQYADDMYRYLTRTLNESGFRTRRRCSANESKTCLCQGEVEETQGASFSFGCSWSMFFDGCKFTKSTNARKFKMQDPIKEEEIEKVLQEMTTQVSPLLKIWAPKCYENMTHFEDIAHKCRIGLNKGCPFSGVTCCLDFCAHSHRDIHDLNNGTTMVCTLLKPNYNERTDEQLHVLPLYQLLDDKGIVIPSNYDNPPHLIKSKITTRTGTCGRYVNPVAVNVKKLTDDHSVLKKEEPNLLCSGFPKHPRFCSESDVPFVLSQRETLSIQNVKKQMIFVDESEIPVYRQCSDYFTKSEDFKLTSKKMEHNNLNSPLKNYKEHVSKPTVITQEMGGVAIALGHGSFLVECAKKELHATTALRNPERSEPTRLSMVFYQHKKLNKKNHGYEDYQEKMNCRLKEKLLKNERSFDDLSLLADTAARNESLNTTFTNISDIKPFIDVEQFKCNRDKKKISSGFSKPNNFSIASLININPNERSHESQTDEYENISKKVNIDSVANKYNISKNIEQSINYNNTPKYDNVVNNIGIGYSNNISKDEEVPLLQNKTEKLPTFSIFKESLYNLSKDVKVEVNDTIKKDFDKSSFSISLTKDNTQLNAAILKNNLEDKSKTEEKSNTNNNFKLSKITKINNGNSDYLKIKRSLSSNNCIRKNYITDSGLSSSISSIDSNFKREVAQEAALFQSSAITDNCFSSKDKKALNEILMDQTVSKFHDCLQSELSVKSDKNVISVEPDKNFISVNPVNKLLVIYKDSYRVGKTCDLNEKMFQKDSIKEPWESISVENGIDSKTNFPKNYRYNKTRPFYKDSFKSEKPDGPRNCDLINENPNFTYNDSQTYENILPKRKKQFDVNSILSNQCTKHETPTDHRITFAIRESSAAYHNLFQNFESRTPVASPNSINQSSFQYIPGVDDDTRSTYSSPEMRANSNFDQATPITERSFSTSYSDVCYKNTYSVSDKMYRYSFPVSEHFEYNSFEFQDNLPHTANNNFESSQSRYLPISDNNLITQNHSLFQPLGPFSATLYKNYPT